jgi:hypothetical protein
MRSVPSNAEHPAWIRNARVAPTLGASTVFPAAAAVTSTCWFSRAAWTLWPPGAVTVGASPDAGMVTDRWELMTVCPTCLIDNRLDVHYGAGGQPWANYPVHLDSRGQRCAWSQQSVPLWDEASTRPTVAGRSGGVCEYCRAARASEMHHRITRGAGGGWYPSNILHLCNGCHRKATLNPRWAQDVKRGISCRAGRPVSQTPVVRYDGSVLWLVDNVAPPPRTPPDNGRARGPSQRRRR